MCNTRYVVRVRFRWWLHLLRPLFIMRLVPLPATKWLVCRGVIMDRVQA